MCCKAESRGLTATDRVKQDESEDYEGFFVRIRSGLDDEYVSVTGGDLVNKSLAF